MTVTVVNLHRRTRKLVFILLGLSLSLIGLLTSTTSWAGVEQDYPVVKQFFPKADRFGDFGGKPPAAAVYSKGKVVGYVFHSKDVAPFPAYSGKPVDILIGIDTKGRIVGTKVLEQHEPILLVGIPVQKLYDFVAQYIGKHVTDEITLGSGKNSVDSISSATVTAAVVNRTIMHAARKVAAARGIISVEQAHLHRAAKVRMDYFHPATWAQLVQEGAIGHLLISEGEVYKAFKGTPAETLPPKDPNTPFADIYFTYLNAPTIGRNLLGDEQYRWLMKKLKPGDHAIAVLGNGYSFKGSSYVRGGIFDRVHVIQGGQQILFHDLDYQRLADVYAKGIPSFREKAIFLIRKANQFDPGAPWQLELLVHRKIGPIKSLFRAFETNYRLPAKYLEKPTSQATQQQGPLWLQMWKRQKVEIAILLAGLLFLILILVFQDWLVRRPRLYERLRVTYLVYTLVFIGWYALGQLSVVNVFTFINAIIHQFRWETFLIDPVIFILWIFVAITLLLFGRGIYCGWLCPFGAFQSLINKLSRRLRVPQFNFPLVVHERLWAIKYVILLVLFGISLQSVNLAERYSEVEPFKTAISLHFMRQWPFVVYAVVLLVASIFNCKFYCKYLCPLGGALAVVGKNRIFEWLRRRKECGHPCQICAVECEVQAIKVTGEINYNECHYCLDCQKTYWDEYKCPPLVMKRKRLERHLRKTADKGAAQKGGVESAANIDVHAAGVSGEDVV